MKEEEEEKEEQVESGRSAPLAHNLSDTLPISPEMKQQQSLHGAMAPSSSFQILTQMVNRGIIY